MGTRKKPLKHVVSHARDKREKWFTDDGFALIAGWARDGLSNDQIAENMDVNRNVLYRWKRKYPEFKELLDKNREVADRHVENALYRRALGYDYNEVTWEEGIETKRVKKHNPPNQGSIEFWLKNRKPDTWREKSEINHSGETTTNLNMNNLSEEELRALANYDETE